MDCLICVFSFGFGGAEGRLIRLAYNINQGRPHILLNEDILQLIKDRHDLVSVVDKLKSEDRITFVPCLPVFLGSFRFIKYIWVFLYSSFFLLLHRPKILHLALGAILLAPLGRFIGGRVLVELTSPDNVRFVERFRWVVGKCVDRYLCVSESIRALKERALGSVPASVYPIPYFEAKNNCNRPSGTRPITISYCARFIARKNPILFAESMLMLRATRSDFKVVMLGGGELNGAVQRIMTPLIDEGVAYVGRVSRPYEEFLSTDIFVSLIERDNYPSQSVLEAMNAGNALILSDVGYSHKFISGNGELVPLSAPEISDAISLLMDDRSSIDVYSKRSRELVFRSFSPELFLHFLEDIYDSEIKSL